MSIRKTTFATLLTAVIAAPAFAGSGITFVGGERGFEFHALPSTTTRAQVKQDLVDWRSNPVAGDGYREVGGERGWEAPQHAYVFQNGTLVHADAFNHNAPKPLIAMARADRERFNMANSGSSQ